MKPYELFYNVLSEMAECKKYSHCLTISDRLDAVRVANLFRNTGFKVEIKNEGLLYILRLNNQK